MVNQNNTNGMPVVQNVEDFDKKSGGLFERLIFSHRVLVILCCLAATAGSDRGWHQRRGRDAGEL